jgi:hypothetical protein
MASNYSFGAIHSPDIVQAESKRLTVPIAEEEDTSRMFADLQEIQAKIKR